MSRIELVHGSLYRWRARVHVPVGRAQICVPKDLLDLRGRHVQLIIAARCLMPEIGEMQPVQIHALLTFGLFPHSGRFRA